MEAISPWLHWIHVISDTLGRDGRNWTVYALILEGIEGNDALWIARFD